MGARTHKTLLLVDGSSYLYRAYHALPPLNTSSGEPTGAVYGVASMLKRLISDYHPDYMAVIFDAVGKTFRHQLYAEYKANRPPMPEDLRAQIEPTHALVKHMGLPLIIVPNVEADDVIGTLATQATKAGMHCIISTGDKDIAQLVNPGVTLVNTMSNTTLDEQGVVEKFGVKPDQIIDYLAIVGDTSDNVPGIPKAGPKTAVKWLSQHQTLDNLIAHADEITGKVGENLRNNLEQLELSRKLVTIDSNLKLEKTPSDLKPNPPNQDELSELITRLEFNPAQWTDFLSAQKTPQPTPGGTSREPRYECVLNKKRFRTWLGLLKKADAFAFDTETTSLDYMQAEIVGVSFAVKPDEAAYVPFAHDYPGAPDQLDRDEILSELKPLLEDPGQVKIGQHAKYDMNVLANYGIKLRGVKFDTMLESYVFNSTATRHDMDSLSATYLSHTTTHYEEVAGKGVKQLTFNQVTLDKAAPYAAEDADITLQLHRSLYPRIRKVRPLLHVLENIEMPLVPVLSRMERTGVLIDADLLYRQSLEVGQRLIELETDAHGVAGKAFNLGSPKQLREILFDQLGIPVVKKTPKGQPSTAEDVLEALANTHELPRLILEHRQLAKLKSTYIDKLPGQVDPGTGRVHTSYHQAVTATGRLSSSDPNLQNIPIRSAEGRRIRQAFVAPPGHVLLAADYSQIELRIMAHLSGDEGLLNAFAEGADIHRATAAEVFGTTLKTVSDEQRRAAKAINFGLIYGMSAFGLARQLDMERNAAQQYVDLYFSRYPAVKTFMDHTRELAREQGYVETLFGRRLYLSEINSTNALRRQGAERAAINAPMQGTAADIIKCAMIDLDHWIESSKTPIRMLMQVHDELVFEVVTTACDQATTAIRSRMESAAGPGLALVVDIGTGANWNEAH